MENYEACVTDRQGNCIRWSHVHAAPPATAPDDAVREVTPAGREQDARRDLRAENERPLDRLRDLALLDTDREDAAFARWHNERVTSAYDAAQAGERAARSRVEALFRWNECHEEVSRAGEAQPCNKPAVALRHDPEEGSPYPVCARHARADMFTLDDLRAALSPTDQDQPAPVLAPPDTAEQEQQR